PPSFPPSLHDALPISILFELHLSQFNHARCDQDLSSPGNLSKNLQRSAKSHRVGIISVIQSNDVAFLGRGPIGMSEDSYLPSLQDRKSTRLNSSHVKI